MKNTKNIVPPPAHAPAGMTVMLFFVADKFPSPNSKCQNPRPDKKKTARAQQQPLPVHAINNYRINPSYEGWLRAFKRYTGFSDSVIIQWLAIIISTKPKYAHSPEVPETIVPLLAHVPTGTIAKLFFVVAITMLLPSKDFETLGNF
eukprot:1146551-Pelagomonas_calceolata.AAC.2